MSLTEDIPQASGGKRSLLMAHVGGKGEGGHLYRRLQPGYEKLHGRFYVKFDPDCAPIHHFGTNLGGNYPSTPWPAVSAGQPPAGDKSFWTGIEPYGKNWVWDYYTYWCDMRGSPPRGQTWGNSFVRDPELKVERGKWICVEVMMKMNDPDDTNGEMAFWLDGKQISHLGKGFPKGKWIYDKFKPGDDGEGIRWDKEKGGPKRFDVPEGGLPFEGFRWRTTKDLNLNYRLGLPVPDASARRSRQPRLVRRHRHRHRLHRPAARQIREGLVMQCRSTRLVRNLQSPRGDIVSTPACRRRWLSKITCSVLPAASRGMLSDACCVVSPSIGAARPYVPASGYTNHR